MMKKMLILLWSFPILLNAQNLVPNPGFETQTSCPLVSEIFKAPPWNSPSAATPDLYNSTCPTQNSISRTGIGHSGFYVISNFPHGREYIQSKLTSPLQNGQTYCVEYYLKRNNSMYASDRIGAYFSKDSVYLNQSGPLPFTPQVQNPDGNFIESTNTWTMLSGNFKAVGGESFIIIGNFFNDQSTVMKPAGTGSPTAYYEIDDVSVTLCTVGLVNVENDNLKIYPNPVNNVLSISSKEPIESLKIFSVSGKMIIEQKSSESLININTNVLSNGSYLVEINTFTGSFVKRVSIIH